MTYGELKRRLRRLGVYLEDQGKRHELWYNPHTNRGTAIPRHDTQEVSPGMLHRILQQLGIPREDLS